MTFNQLASPFHSTNIEAPDVYHIFRDCPPATQIPKKIFAYGTNEYRKCERYHRRA